MEKINARNFALPFKDIVNNCPELEPFLTQRKSGALSIDLADPKSLQTYNICLFRILEGIKIQVPAIVSQNNLIPTCGLRRAIVHTICKHLNPKKVIEIGTGPYAIMALLFAKRGIKVIASEIDDISFQTASYQLQLNDLNIRKKIELVKSTGGILKFLRSYFPADCIVSLPPFYNSEEGRVSNKKGFLGTNTELYTHGSCAESFSLSLLEEWLGELNSIKHLCILWKSKKALQKGLDYLEQYQLQHQHSKQFSREIIQICAGTRTRFLSIIS